MPRKGKTLEEVRFSSRIKRLNTRIRALYEEGQKVGNMYAYQKYTAKLQAENAIEAGISYVGKKGFVQLSTSPSKYKTSLGSKLSKVNISTITEVKKHGSKLANTDVTFEQAERMIEVSDLKAVSFLHMSNLMDEYLLDEQINEEIPEMIRKKKGETPRKDAGVSFEQLLEKMFQS